MEEILIPASIVTFGAGLGVLGALIFDSSMLIGALIGAAIPAFFLMGFYLAVFVMLAGFIEFITGGKK